MAAVIPIELFELLENKIGREEAKEVIEAIEASLEVIEKRAEAVALEKKLEIKEELTRELATKADIATLKGDIRTLEQELKGNMRTLEQELGGNIRTLEQKVETVRQEIQTAKVELDRKFTIMFIILFFTIVFLNQNALEFLARVLGLIR